jgi:hypothetical protein
MTILFSFFNLLPVLIFEQIDKHQSKNYREAQELL